jgi:hypothetical protein
MLITILNIPNYCSSYYLFGLSQAYEIQYAFDARYMKYNNTPLIYQVSDKIGIIDNTSHGWFKNYMRKLSLYFVTNMHKELESYNQIKVRLFSALSN